MDTTMVLRKNSVLVLGLGVLLAGGCASSDENDEPVVSPTEMPKTNSTNSTKTSPPGTGLPGLHPDSLCDVPYRIEFDEWAQSADAVVLFDVDDMRMNRDVVYYAGYDTGTKISISECQPRSVDPGLILTVSNLEFFTGNVTDIKQVHIGSFQTLGWVPRPFVYDDELRWSVDGERLGPGLRVGAALYKDPDSLKWSARGLLFELDPDSKFVSFQEGGPCLSLSDGFTSQTLSDFRTQFDSLSAAQSDVADFRTTRDYASPAKREEYFVATHCTPSNLPADPEERDTEVNGN